MIISDIGDVWSLQYACRLIDQLDLVRSFALASISKTTRDVGGIDDVTVQL